jgi:hypothetical protein
MALETKVFFFLNFGGVGGGGGRTLHLNGIQLPIRLCSLLQNGFNRLRKYLQGGKKESTNKKTHTNTHRGVGDSEKAQRQLPHEQSHCEAANPSRPKQGGT